MNVTATVREINEIILKSKEIFSPSIVSPLDSSKYMLIRDYEMASKFMGGYVFSEKTLWPDITENTLCRLIRLYDDMCKSGSIKQGEFSEIQSCLDGAMYRVQMNLGSENIMIANNEDGNIKLDLLVIAHAKFMLEYCDIGARLFSGLLSEAYVNGWLPCGWHGGVFPSGKMVAFKNVTNDEEWARYLAFNGQ